MSTPENIFLIGLMGAGKSTVGKQLAKGLRKEFVDCDSELERRTGANIPLIFELEGEEGFRRRESALLDELTSQRGIVLATGGGVVMADTNRAALMSRGYVIYLKAPLELLVTRTSRDRNRPMLHTEDPAERMRELYELRDPLYRQTADMIVQTDRRSSRLVVREIVRRLSET